MQVEDHVWRCKQHQVVCKKQAANPAASSSTRLWLSNSCQLRTGAVKPHTLVRVLHPRWTVVIWRHRQDRKLLSRNTLTWRPVTSHRHRTIATHTKGFPEGPGGLLSWGREKCVDIFGTLPRFLKNLLKSENLSVVLRKGRKRHWVSSSFGSII